MDLSSLSITLSQLNQPSTSQDIGVLMLSKQLDTTETLSAEMIKAMEQSVTPAVGGNIDLYV